MGLEWEGESIGLSRSYIGMQVDGKAGGSRCFKIGPLISPYHGLPSPLLVSHHAHAHLVTGWHCPSSPSALY